MTSDPRYPIGRFLPPETVTAAARSGAILTLAELPNLLRDAARDLSPEQINTPYRDGGWTVRQVVHHVADSHATALFRFKKALTEEWPGVPGYDEASFAKLPDMDGRIEWSLTMLDSIHARWVMLLQALSEEDWKRGYMHAERGRQVLELVAVHYAWHSLHHTAHITHLRAGRGW